MDDRRRVVARIDPLARGVVQDRRAQFIVRMDIGAPDAFVDHVGDRHGDPLPLDTHADFDEGADDAGVLADRPSALGTQPGIREDLGDRVLRRRRLLGFIRFGERRDVVLRMEVGNVLKRVRDARNQVLLMNLRHVDERRADSTQRKILALR